MRARRAVSLAGIVAVTVLLLGCDFSWLIIDQNRTDAPAKEQPAATAKAPSAAAKGTARGQATSGTQEPDVGLAGTWTGTLAFTSYEMLIADERAAELFAEDIEATLEEPYPFTLTIESDSEEGSPATLDFDGKVTISGTASRRGDTVRLVFKRAGDATFEVSSSPPVSFMFTGKLGSQPAMRGTLVYEVYQVNGAKGWVEQGRWDAARD